MEKQLPIQTVPESVRSLFDPAQPIPEDVWFQPRIAGRRPFLLNLIFTGMLAGNFVSFCGLCMFIALAGSVLDGTQKIRDVGDVIVIILLALVFVGLIIVGWVAFWNPLRIEWQTLREQRAGILRRGLFLTPEAMIVRTKTNTCDIIPRDSIADLGFIGRRWREWRVYCKPQAGMRTDPYGYVEYALDFPPFDQRDTEAISRIREWAEHR